MMGCTLDTSGLSSSGVKWRFQSASSLLQNLQDSKYGTVGQRRINGN